MVYDSVSHLVCNICENMQSIVTDAAYKIVRGTSLMIITDHLLRRTHKQRQVLFRFSFQLASRLWFRSRLRLYLYNAFDSRRYSNNKFAFYVFATQYKTAFKLSVFFLTHQHSNRI